MIRPTKSNHPFSGLPQNGCPLFLCPRILTGELPGETACGRRMERSTGQQLKMIPLGDQQPFLLQLGKLHRHGGTFHAEKICQLLTVKGDVKGERRLPDGLGGQVGQQLFPGGALADMGDLIVKK